MKFKKFFLYPSGAFFFPWKEKVVFNVSTAAKKSLNIKFTIRLLFFQDRKCVKETKEIAIKISFFNTSNSNHTGNVWNDYHKDARKEGRKRKNIKFLISLRLIYTDCRFSYPENYIEKSIQRKFKCVYGLSHNSAMNRNYFGKERLRDVLKLI